MDEHCRGFTIIELMITLLVLAVVIGIAVPSFNQQIANSRSLAVGDEISSALNFGRSEAVKRARNVSVCASVNGTTCGTASNWNAGFIVFVDSANETSETPVLSEVLQVWEGDGNAVIAAKRNGEAKSFVRFTSLGTAARLQHPQTIIDVKTPGCTGTSASRIEISVSGAVAVSPASCL